MAALTNIGPQTGTIWEARDEEGTVVQKLHVVHDSLSTGILLYRTTYHLVRWFRWRQSYLGSSCSSFRAVLRDTLDVVINISTPVLVHTN